jgi:hypothetical protein
MNTTVLEFIEKFQCTAEEFYRVMTMIKVRVMQRGNAEGSGC